MSTHHHHRPKPPPRPRRMLGSGVLDILAGPPGVDGYLEQVKPDLGRPRLSRRGHRRRARRPRTASRSTLRANAPGRASAPDSSSRSASRSTACGVRAATRRPRSPAPARDLELTVKSHPEGLVSNFLIERAPGPG